MSELISQEKFDSLSGELEDLRTKRRREVAEQLEYARSLGDLSENAEYQQARELQASVEERIAKLEEVLKDAQIVSEENTGDIVGMGSHVTVQKEGSSEKSTYSIVGAEEADIPSGKVSYHSPLGNALMGKKKNNEFSFRTPKGVVKYKILKVE